MPKTEGKQEGIYQPEVGRIHNTPMKDSLKIGGMAREVSQATWDCWKTTEGLWKILNAIADDKIEKFEWDFILKSMGGNEEILSRNDSDFLFFYLDKDNSGDISKPELRALLNLVVRINKWNENNPPTKEQMIRAAFQYALNDKKNHSMIDYTLQMALIGATNSLTNLLKDMRSAKAQYAVVTKAITDGKRKVFRNPRKIFDEQLKEHEDIINKYAGPMKKRYGAVRQLLNEAEKEYNFVNAQVKQFLDQGQELERLRDRDEKCCKIFGCLCPCTF